jgi:hypothetical protein
MQRINRKHTLTCVTAVVLAFLVLAQERVASAGACLLCINHEIETEFGTALIGRCEQSDFGFHACGHFAIPGGGSYCEPHFPGCFYC